MIPASLPPGEERRLAALRQYAVLDTLPEQALDDLTKLASHICEAPIALISLVDEDRQWFKAKVGLGAAQTSRDVSFCAHALHGPELFIVPDAVLDARFAQNPLVTGEPGIRFYAGAPLLTPEGVALGTLCVIDRVPRQLNASQQEALRVLSRQVMTQLELRRQTRELAERERLLRTIFDSEPECVKVLGPDGSLRMMNRAGLAMIEADSLGQVAGHCIYGLVAAEHRAQFEALTERVFRGETGTLEFQSVGLKGTACWLETHAAPLRDESGAVTALLGITRDITARKRAETRIQYLNRVYAVLSDINQTIVRVRDPQELFDSACRIAVEKGQFRMAWIGAGDASGSRVRLAAHAGAAADTVKIMEALLGDEPGKCGCSFTLHALQTGRHGVCNDIASDPQTAGWRDAALQRGYRAMASFPLKVEDTVVGTFNLYAGDPDFFDEQELRLLDELAIDLGFALQVSRREAERVRAEESLRESEERFRLLTELISDYAYSLHIRPDGTPKGEWLTDAFARVFGFSLEGVEARGGLLSLIHI